MREAKLPTSALGALLLGFVALSAPACRGLERDRVASDYPPVEAAELGNMHNVSVSGEIWFGGVPTSEDLDLARRRGITHVIDLCTPEERPDFEVSRACERLGFACFDPGLVAADAISDQVVDQVLAQLNVDDRGPTLIFCGTGGRSAMFFAVHRVVDQGVPLERALVEARRAGMKPGDSEEFVRAQVERLTSS